MLLVQFFHEQDWIDFRGPELQSLLAMHGIVTDITPTSSMFLTIDLDISTEILVQICRRAVLIKAIYQFLASADDLDSLAENACTSGFVETIPSTASWSLGVHAVNKSLSSEVKESYRGRFAAFISRLAGPIQLVEAEVELRVLMEFDPFATHTTLPPPPADNDVEDKTTITTPSKVSCPCFLGRVLASGGMRAEVKKFDLKTRNYVGPTSLDHVLALLVANITRVRPGCLVYDPFVGTASLLVAASHFQAVCFGSDIDIRVLKGDMYAGQGSKDDPSVRRDIFGTFDAYRLPRPELIRMDNSVVERHMQGDVASELLDAILTDPPYGIRAGARKSGRKGAALEIAEERREQYFPATQQYAVEEVMLDLLHTAASLLRLGGRLSYLIPTPYDFIADRDLPRHPCLTLELACCQTLSTRHGRHLVVVRKTSSYTAEARQAYIAYKTRVLTGDDEGFGRLMSKLQTALAPEAHGDATVLKKMSNRCSKRKASKRKQAALKQQGGGADGDSAAADTTLSVAH